MSKCIDKIKDKNYLRVGNSTKIDPKIKEFTLQNLIFEGMDVEAENDLLKQMKQVKTSRNPDKRQ